MRHSIRPWIVCAACAACCIIPRVAAARPVKHTPTAHTSRAPQAGANAAKPVEIEVILDGERVSPDYTLVERRIPSLLIDGEPMLPVRAFDEKGFGGLVLYLESAGIYGLGDDVAVKRGDRVALRGQAGKEGEPGWEFVLPAAPRQVGARIYVPARGLLPLLGYSVGWNEAKCVLTVRSHAVTPPEGRIPAPATAQLPVTAGPPITVSLDGKVVLKPGENRQQVRLVEGRPMLSAAFVQDALGLKVSRWRQRWGVYEVGGLYVVDGWHAAFEGRGLPGGGFGIPFPISLPARVIDGELYLPPGEILRYSGFVAEWDANEQSLRIKGGRRRLAP